MYEEVDGGMLRSVDEETETETMTNIIRAYKSHQLDYNFGNDDDEPIQPDIIIGISIINSIYDKARRVKGS